MKFSKESTGEKSNTVLVIPNDKAIGITARLSVGEKLGVVPEENPGAIVRVCLTNSDGRQVSFEGTGLLIESRLLGKNIQ